MRLPATIMGPGLVNCRSGGAGGNDLWGPRFAIPLHLAAPRVVLSSCTSGHVRVSMREEEKASFADCQNLHTTNIDSERPFVELPIGKILFY